MSKEIEKIMEIALECEAVTNTFEEIRLDLDYPRREVRRSDGSFDRVTDSGLLEWMLTGDERVAFLEHSKSFAYEPHFGARNLILRGMDHIDSMCFSLKQHFAMARRQSKKQPLNSIERDMAPLPVRMDFTFAATIDANNPQRDVRELFERGTGSQVKFRIFYDELVNYHFPKDGVKDDIKSTFSTKIIYTISGLLEYFKAYAEKIGPSVQSRDLIRLAMVFGKFSNLACEEPAKGKMLFALNCRDFDEFCSEHRIQRHDLYQALSGGSVRYKIIPWSPNYTMSNDERHKTLREISKGELILPQYPNV